jgi:Fe-S-cluster containining protein
VSNRQRDIRLAKLYARLPRLDCRGLCSISCGEIHPSVRERAVLERAAGRELGTQPGTAVLPDGRRQPVRLCSMLTEEGRCSVYTHRPAICRLWGVVENMRCPHGCQPDPRHLTVDEAHRLLDEAFEIGGRPHLNLPPRDRGRDLVAELVGRGKI